MTAHPIDTEALARRAGHILFTEGPEQPAATARETCVLLDLLAAAEHRATRAEAQSAIRGRAVRLYQERASEAEAERDAARGYISELETAVQSRNDVIKHRDARIKAVRELHYPAHNNQGRTPFCPDCKGAPGVHECGCWRDKQETPVCGHCRGWKGVGPVEWPCPTIRALDGDA